LLVYIAAGKAQYRVNCTKGATTMAWSDAARAAAAEARRRNKRQLLYSPGKNSVHVNRSVMAAYLREARSTGLRGRGKSLQATRFATHTLEKNPSFTTFTNVKGAHFVDQGLKGTAWRYAKGGRAAQRGYPTKGTPGWAAKAYKFSK
jgi:hypothetical protein